MTKFDIDKELFEVSHNRKSFKSLFIYIIYSFKNDIKSLLAYGGGKYKMRKELNEIFNNFLSKHNQYDTYIDGFFGMGGSLKSLSDSLEKHGVKNVIVNELNPCICTMHENIRNSPKEMTDYFLEFIRTEIIIPYKKLYISAEDFLEVKQVMIKRFYQFQDKGEFGVETSTLMMMISAFNFSGMMSFNKVGLIRFGKPIYQFQDIDDMFYKTLKRIDTFSELYNRFEMKFINGDYFNLYHHFKDRKNTLWNIDPVYLKQDYRKYDKDEMKNFKNSDIVECTVNYAQSKFNHIGVLDGLKDIDFIYNNNTSPLLHYYIDILNLEYIAFDRKGQISNSIEVEDKKVSELILYQNNFNKNRSTAINNSIPLLSTQRCA